MSTIVYKPVRKQIRTRFVQDRPSSWGKHAAALAIAVFAAGLLLGAWITLGHTLG